MFSVPAMLVAWVDGGAPSGQTLEEAEQPPVFVPSAPVWQHGEPDVVVRTSEHHVASGTVDQIQRFDVASGLTGDQRVHGIAFKPGTDDLRESPLAELASRLISKGLELKVYDPYVWQAVEGGVSAMGRGNDVVPDLPTRLVGKIEDLISSSDVILVGNRYEETIAPLNAVSEYRSLVDLTRINASLRSNGTYEGICW